MDALSVAAPIRVPEGVVAAISLVVAHDRADPVALAPLVQAAGRVVSRALNNPPAHPSDVDRLQIVDARSNSALRCRCACYSPPSCADRHRRKGALMSLDGKVAIVTGSGRGLGLAYAQELARRGASVVVNDVDAEATADAAAAIRRPAAGPSRSSHRSARPRPRKQLVDHRGRAVRPARHPRHQRRVLRDKVLWKMTDDDFDTVINVHLRGTFTTRPGGAVRHAQARARAGGIILVGSPAGQRGNFGQTNYAAAKAGIVGMVADVGDGARARPASPPTPSSRSRPPR